MRINCWVFGVISVGTLGAGALSQQACSSSSAPMEVFGDSGADTSPGTGQEGGSSCPTYSPTETFKPGTGAACTAPVGCYPDPACDPSDETAQSCQTAAGTGCTVSAKCGDVTTCEPFVKNPAPATGVDNFRMRLINLTAPPALASTVVQTAIVTAAVDLPSAPDAGGASCGENGTGYFNWLISVDQANKKVTTGGAPPSTDPFGVGYCFLKGTVGGQAIAPVTIDATFTGNTFSTAIQSGQKLPIPIFIPNTSGGPPAVVILPISEPTLTDVTVSADGNCIGSLNNNPSSVGPACVDPTPSGTASCSRWHSAGDLGGYITLADAQGVVVTTLGGESLCVLLNGGTNMTGNPPMCNAAGLTSGDYCETKNGVPAHPCANGDSVWLTAQFAASAVNITAGTGVSLCNGGTGSGVDAGG